MDRRSILSRTLARIRSGCSAPVVAPVLVACGVIASATSFATTRVPDTQATAPLSTAPQQLQELSKKHPKKTPAPAEPQTTYDYIAAQAVSTTQPSTARRQRAVTQNKAAADHIDSGVPATSISVSAITPLCPTLSINTAYTLSGTATGGSYCYHFQLAQRSKTQAFLIGQNANTDFALTLVRHEENDTLTVLGTSDQVGNADEVLLALTQPGHYYWLMDAIASDGSPFQFGAVTNTAADAHELNDVPALATVIPDDRTPMIGNMDSAQDVDYFRYTAQFGQDVLVRMDDTFGLNEWTLEYFTGSFWTPMGANTDSMFSNLPTPATIYLRVRPTASVPLNTTHTYRLVVGSFVRASDMVNVSSPENLVPVPLGATPSPLVTQAHNQLNWSMRVLDSKGNPVRGVQVNFILGADEIPVAAHPAFSNAAGIASGSLTLPDCSGDFDVLHSGQGYQWLTEYDVGIWLIEVPNTIEGEVGVGGPNVPNVTFGHICRQTLQ